MSDDSRKPYTMSITRRTIDQLGVKMYDKISAAMTELAANAWDADAESVTIKVPLGKALATHTQEGIDEKGYTIEVVDDGHGMAPEEANDLYLPVGKARRRDPKQGERSREKKRVVMGRKGIGKLAPFGVCREIEVRSAGGEKTERGYEVSHFKMIYDDILEETEEPYYPPPLEDDRTYDDESGTMIRLRNFHPRRVPNKETFHRQLARRFGLKQKDFQVVVNDIKEDGRESPFVVGSLKIPLMENTRIDVSNRPVLTEDGEELPVRGWVGMAKDAYKNEEMAGVRIYVRGKLASTTRDFFQPAGFTGEFFMRSYLVGEIHADWLDEDGGEDLICTHRQDILWSTARGEAFSKWGRELIKELSRRAWEPKRKRVRDLFLEASQLEKRARERFENPDLVEAALEIGKKIGGFASEDELEDQEYVDGLAEIVLMVAPHVLLVDTLREMQEKVEGEPVDLEKLTEMFRRTRVAELASYAHVADERVRAIERLDETIHEAEPRERELQEILEDAPWLIEPQWSPVSENQALRTFRRAFETWYEKEHGVAITTSTITDEDRRPDFVLIHVGNALQIVEIKRPGHSLTNEEWRKLRGYHDSVGKFLEENPNFYEDFPKGAKMTLVCDDLNVNGVAMDSLKHFKENGTLTHRTWDEFLRSTIQAHKQFLKIREITTQIQR